MKMVLNNSKLPILLLLLLFVAVFSALFSPVKPDAAAVKNLCSKTGQPVICSDCLNSDPGSKTADGRGLAIIAIGCAEKNARLMAQNVGTLYRATPDSSPLKTILNDCWLSTGSGAGNFPGMKTAVAAGDYAHARNNLEIAVRNVDSCLAKFNQDRISPVPSEVLTGTLAVDQGCQIISNILDNI